MSEVGTTRDARAATWSGVGGLLASFGAVATWFCCIPVVAGAAGGLAAIAGFAWDARPWFLGAAGLFLAIGFWYAYRPQRCPEGVACATPPRRRRARVILWLSTAIALLALTFPRWSSWAYYTFL
jgi:mercuric ion transport protein